MLCGLVGQQGGVSWGKGMGEHGPGVMGAFDLLTWPPPRSHYSPDLAPPLLSEGIGSPEGVAGMCQTSGLAVPWQTRLHLPLCVKPVPMMAAPWSPVSRQEMINGLAAPMCCILVCSQADRFFFPDKTNAGPSWAASPCPLLPVAVC